MFILFPPTFVDLSGEFVNFFLSRFAFGNNFFVAEVVQKSLNLLNVNIRWQLHDDGICRAFDGHDNSFVSPQRYWQIADYPSQELNLAGECSELSTASLPSLA